MEPPILLLNGDAVTCLDKLILHSILNNASDIHMDVQDEKGYIKIRVNGKIFYYGITNHFLYLSMLGVVKSRAHLRIDVHDKGQDGSFIFFYKNKVFIRVSINPTVHGESVVMRLLNPNTNNFKTLEEIGMGQDLITLVREYSDLENSLILISGATGSGKTTTMYSIMSEINPLSTIIISLEEPVEKYIPNVRQVSIKEGFSYADALRVALRQDPDVIVVGEIRDRETAQIAIEAALTGHLIIAGVHGRDPVDVLFRLKNFGIDDFLVSQTLSLSIHQKMIYENNEMKVDFSYLDYFKNSKCKFEHLKREIKKSNEKTN